MFGKRCDGTRLKGIDPMVQFTPYIMPHRYDAMVETRVDLDFDSMTRYIRDQRKLGNYVTHMGIIIAALVRVCSQNPQMNRFVVGKKLFARNQFCISFVTLKKTDNGSVEESLCTVQFDLKDTIFDVSQRLAQAIEEGRKVEEKNATDKLAGALLKIPGLPSLIVCLARHLDNHGLMPKFIHEASPFHTSLFISNMASIGMNYVFHHIYDFGTASVFLTMGKTEQKISVNSDGTCRSKRIMPMGAVIDERIASGETYAFMFSEMAKYLMDPKLLETPPEKIVTETEFLPVPPARRDGESR